jgi:hypothetical protein
MINGLRVTFCLFGSKVRREMVEAAWLGPYQQNVGLGSFPRRSVTWTRFALWLAGASLMKGAA